MFNAASDWAACCIITIRRQRNGVPANGAQTETNQNLEGTLGYRVPLTTTFSLTGSVGIGEHWRQNPAAAFPYYVLRIGGDLDLNQTVTWNIVSFRYRDGFDPDDHYNTPQIATGFTYRLDGRSSISAKIMRNWREGDPSNTGVSLGFKQQF